MLHNFFRPDERDHDNLDVALVRKKGHRLTDYIAPDGMEFQADYFKIGRKFGRTLCLHEYPSYLRDTMISELTGLPKQMMLSIDMVSEDKALSQATVNRKLTAVGTEIGNTSRKAIEQNNAMPSIPPRLAEKKKGLEEVLQLIGEYDQRIVWAQVTLFHMADTLEELNADTDTLKSIGQRYMCTFGVCTYEQEQAMNTALPYGLQCLNNQRTLTSEKGLPCSSYWTRYKTASRRTARKASAHGCFATRRMCCSSNPRPWGNSSTAFGAGSESMARWASPSARMSVRCSARRTVVICWRTASSC